MTEQQLLVNNNIEIAPPSECCRIDLSSDEEKLLPSQEFNAISNYAVYDEIGNRHTIAELSADFKTIFVFVRSFLCFTSKEYVEDLAKIPKQTFIDKQVRLVVIGCANWKHIKSFRKLTKFPYLMFCDVDYDIYNKLGFLRNQYYGNHKDSIHVKSSNFIGLFQSAKRAITTSDAFDYQGRFDQQGGALIVGPGPVVHFIHKDQHARGHVPINQLLEKVDIPPVNFISTKSI